MFNKITESIETLINQVTNRCIQNRESEIQQIDNEKKLLLWIAGLALGLELFIINNIKWEHLNWFSAILYTISGLAFLYNAFLALVAYQMINNLHGIDAEIKKSYNLQCIFLIELIHSSPHKIEELNDDLKRGELTLKLMNLEYFGKKELLKNPIINLAKRMNRIVGDSASKVLIVHFIVSICLFCTYNRVF